MADILFEGAARASDGNESRLDLDGDSLRDVELFGRHNVAHLTRTDSIQPIPPQLFHNFLIETTKRQHLCLSGIAK